MICTLTDGRIQFINTHSFGALDQVLMGWWMDGLLWTLNQLQWLINIELFKQIIECGAFEWLGRKRPSYYFDVFLEQRISPRGPRRILWILYMNIYYKNYTKILAVRFTCAAREPAHNKRCGPLSKRIFNHTGLEGLIKITQFLVMIFKCPARNLTPHPPNTMDMRYLLSQRARSEVRPVDVDYRQCNRSFSWGVEQDFDLRPHLLCLHCMFTANTSSCGSGSTILNHQLTPQSRKKGYTHCKCVIDRCGSLVVVLVRG
jgi:hypothetical protein